jgi:hypothetical protein
VEYIAASEGEERLQRERNARQTVLEADAAMGRRLRRLTYGLGVAVIAATAAAAYGWNSNNVAVKALKGQEEALGKAETNLEAARKAEDQAKLDRVNALLAKSEEQKLNRALQIERVTVTKERDKAQAASVAALAAKERVGYQKLALEATLALNTDPQDAVHKAQQALLGDRLCLPQDRGCTSIQALQKG